MTEISLSFPSWILYVLLVLLAIDTGLNVLNFYLDRRKEYLIQKKHRLRRELLKKMNKEMKEVPDGG